jgi:O-antigen/teichoic acid export membrane protein
MSLKKTTFWFVLVNGLNFGINFIFAPFLSRALSMEEYGSFGQTLMVSQFIILIFCLGIPSVYTMLLSEYKEKISFLFSQVNYLLLIFSILSIPLQIILAHNSQNWIGNDIKTELSIFVFHTIGGILSSILTLHLVYRQTTKPLLWATLLLNALKVCFALFMIQYHHSYIGFIWIIAIIPLLNFILLYFLVPSHDKKWEKFNFKIAKKITKESYPYFILGLLGHATLYIDGWMVSKMLSVEEYAIYRNGAIEIPFIATIYSSVATVMLGRISDLFREGKINEIFELKRKASTMIAALIYPIVIFLIINADYLIPLYFSEKYSKSSYVFVFYSFSVLIRINDYQDLLILMKKRKNIILSNLLSFIVNFFLIFILIKQYKSYGASIAYSISIILLATLMTFYTLKNCSKKISSYFDLYKISYIIALCVLILFTTNIFKSNFIIFVFYSIFALLLVYLIEIKTLKLYELKIIPNILKKWLT